MLKPDIELGKPLSVKITEPTQLTQFVRNSMDDRTITGIRTQGSEITVYSVPRTSVENRKNAPFSMPYSTYSSWNEPGFRTLKVPGSSRNVG